MTSSVSSNRNSLASRNSFADKFTDRFGYTIAICDIFCHSDDHSSRRPCR
ncbi:MAG: hypothetical protein U0521_18950 [Anaerolineae bacterium]